VPGAPIFACAGIWRDSEVPSFAILSTGDGLPLVLHPDDHGAWLADDWKQARPMVEAAASCSPCAPCHRTAPFDAERADMSVAFRRDGDEEHLEPKFELPIPPPAPIWSPRAGWP
jgi:hypothetical protein